MGKGINKRLSQVVLPLGLGVVGSLSLIVWSQKPVAQAAVAAAPTAVVTEQTASFDPYHPTAQVQDSTPAVAPAAPVMVSYQAPASPVATNGANYTDTSTVSIGSGEIASTFVASNTSEAGNTVVQPTFQASAVAADTSAVADNAYITAKSATITVGTADIFVLSSANIHYVN